MSRLFWCGYLTAHYRKVPEKCFRNAEKCQKYCRNAKDRLILNLQQEKMMDLVAMKNSEKLSNSKLLWQ